MPLSTHLFTRRTALVAACTLALITLHASGARATFRGHSNRITWAVDAADPNYHVTSERLIENIPGRHRPAGTIASCTTMNPSCPVYTHVSYSPDGKRLAWAMTDVTGQTQIVLANSDGTHRMTIAHPGENDFEPSFAPSGGRLVYVRLIGSATVYQIVTSNLSGGNIRVVATVPTVPGPPLSTNPIPGIDPAASPDGRHILYTSGGSMWIVGSAGRNPHQLIAGGRRADWSPSGRQIVYISQAHQIDIARANGTRRRRLRISLPAPPALTFLDYAVFSSDGTRIAFAGVNIADAPTLYVVSVNGGRAREVRYFYTGDESNGEPGVVGLSWQP